MTSSFPFDSFATNGLKPFVFRYRECKHTKHSTTTEEANSKTSREVFILAFRSYHLILTHHSHLSCLLSPRGILFIQGTRSRKS